MMPLGEVRRTLHGWPRLKRLRLPPRGLSLALVKVPKMAYVWAQAGDELGKEVFVTEILLGIAALLAILGVDGSGKAHL